MANPVQGYFDSTSYTLDVNGFPIWNMAVGSEFMAKFAHTVLGNGAAAVTTGGFQVVKKTGMTVTVKPYFICKDGYMMYQPAETDITFTSSVSEQVFYIGARLDVANNHFENDDVYAYTAFVPATDIMSCKLTITANAVTITDGMIEDLRYNTTYCGQIDAYRERSLKLIADAEEELAALQAAAAEVTVETIGAMPKEAISSNLLINGGFNVNQRAKSGTVTLSAGAYGHDRWKAGASGCTYTFATSGNVTTLTISAGSLIQVVEGLNLQSGTVCLSWTGTAQGKIGAGEYSASGVTGTATGGTNLNIEFNTGTLSNVQLNYGSSALPFVPRLYNDELMLCCRYFNIVDSNVWYTCVSNTTKNVTANAHFRTQMRTTPTCAFVATSSISIYLSDSAISTVSVTLAASGSSTGRYITVSANLTAGTVTAYRAGAMLFYERIHCDAEL